MTLTEKQSFLELSKQNTQFPDFVFVGYDIVKVTQFTSEQLFVSKYDGLPSKISRESTCGRKIFLLKEPWEKFISFSLLEQIEMAKELIGKETKHGPIIQYRVTNEPFRVKTQPEDKIIKECGAFVYLVSESLARIPFHPIYFPFQKKAQPIFGGKSALFEGGNFYLDQGPVLSKEALKKGFYFMKTMKRIGVTFEELEKLDLD